MTTPSTPRPATPDRAARTTPSGPLTGGQERRRNPHLRELIDEMLATVRATLRQELITDAERVDAERQLEQIMARVRSETTRRPAPPRMD